MSLKTHFENFVSDRFSTPLTVLVNKNITTSRKEICQLDHDIEALEHENKVFVKTTIRQLELDYMLGKSASINPVKTDEIIDNENITEEVAYA